MPHTEEDKKRRREELKRKLGKITVGKAIRTVLPLGPKRVEPPSIQEQRISQGLPPEPLPPANATAITPQQLEDSRRKVEEAAFRAKKEEGLRVFRDPETKEIIGSVEGGKGFGFGANQAEDVRERLARREEKIQPTPIGGREALSLRPQFEQQQQLLQAIGKIGQVGGLTAAQEAEINFSQAFTAGLASSVPGIVGGIATGAVAGAIGGPIGILGGGIIGGVGAFIAGTLNNIKTQQRGELGAAKEELTSATTQMRQLAMMATRDPANADYYITLYNTQLTRIFQAQAQTRVETNGDLNSWIEDGREELAQFDVFLRPGGIADIYGDKIRVALTSGTPLSVAGDQLFFDEEIK